MPTAFVHGNGVIVETCGEGKLHLLSYASNAKLPNHIGTITANSKHTRFLISHSYTFTQFAFYWDGSGHADARIGMHIVDNPTVPVGKDWANACQATYGGGTLSKTDVSDEVKSAEGRDGRVTAFIIP